MAVAYLNSNTAINAGAGTTLSGNQTVNAGTIGDRAIIAYIKWNDLNSGSNIVATTGVQYNGVNMVSLGPRLSLGGGTAMYTRAYVLAGASLVTGSNVLLVTWDNTETTSKGAIIHAWEGVDQTTPIHNYNTFAGVSNGSGQGQLAITSATGERTFTGMISGDAITLSSDKTLRWSDSGAGAAFDDAPGAAGTVTHTWSITQTGATLTILGASLQASAGAPAASTSGMGDPMLSTRLQRPPQGGIYY